MSSNTARDAKATKPAAADPRRKPTPPAPAKAEHPTWSRDELQRILAEREAWSAGELAEVLARPPRRRKAFETDSGIPIPDVLDPASLPESDFRRDIGYPGGYPFTRGPQPTMYRGRLWTMRQFAGFG